MTEGPYKLPQGWCWVRLGEVASLFFGTWGEDPTLKDLKDSFVLVHAIRVSDIKETLIINYEKVPVRFVKQKQAEKYTIKDGDIVVVKFSGSKAKVISGRAALFVKQNARFIPSNFVFCVRPKSEAIQAVFLWYWLNSIHVKMHIEKIVRTFTYPNLKKSDYLNTPVPLPPLSEQRRIVAYLKKVRDCIQALKKVHENTEACLGDLERSILDKAFRGDL